jgi:hypothetical protein
MDAMSAKAGRVMEGEGRYNISRHKNVFHVAVRCRVAGSSSSWRKVAGHLLKNFWRDSSRCIDAPKNLRKEMHR